MSTFFLSGKRPIVPENTKRDPLLSQNAFSQSKTSKKVKGVPFDQIKRFVGKKVA